nr:MAG TPA: hypothetical protein [Caudoviricetes sp.]
MNLFKTKYYATNKTHYDRFIADNQSAIETLRSLCGRAMDKLFVRESRKDSLFDSFLRVVKPDTRYETEGPDEDHIGYVHKIFRDDQLEAFRKTYFNDRKIDINISNLSRESFEFGLYGDIKLGDRSKATLKRDLESSKAFSYIDNDDGISNKMNFDIRSACMVGWNLGENVNYSDFIREREFIFEFSTLLVRFMMSDRYLKNKEMYDEYIIDTLVQKMLLFIMNHYLFIKTLVSLRLIKGVTRYVDDIKYRDTNIIAMTKVLFVYKMFYDMVNECNTSILIRSLNDMLSYLEIALRQVSTANGMTNAFDVIARPTVMYEQHGVRYIDYIISRTFDKIDKLKRSFVLTADYAAYQLNGGIRRLNVLDVALESVQNEHPDYVDLDDEDLINIDKLIEDTSNSVDKIVIEDEFDNDIIEAITSEIIPVGSSQGVESTGNNQKTEYVSIATLIGKLPPNIGQRYRKLEAEAVKIKASAMNCEDVNTQTIILRNISAFVRIVGIYRNQYKNNEEFQALAIALEDQIYEVRNALTDRNFFRERATRLYGVARADLDY